MKWEEPMQSGKILYWMASGASILCFVLSFGFSGHWWLASISMIGCLLWIFTGFMKTTELPYLSFFLMIVLGVVGIIMGVSFALIFLGIVLSFGAWDLSILLGEMGRDLPDNYETQKYFKRHQRSLASVLIISGLIVFIGSSIKIQLNFIWLTFMIILFLWIFDKLGNQFFRK